MRGKFILFLVSESDFYLVGFMTYFICCECAKNDKDLLKFLLIYYSTDITISVVTFVFNFLFYMSD